jgi:hypothetical protein
MVQLSARCSDSLASGSRPDAAVFRRNLHPAASDHNGKSAPGIISIKLMMPYGAS